VDAVARPSARRVDAQPSEPPASNASKRDISDACATNEKRVKPRSWRRDSKEAVAAAAEDSGVHEG
jgi:hypothetical protein